MKKLLTLIWLGLMFLSADVHAQTRPTYTSPAARQAMVQWVEDNSPKHIDVVKARQFVNLAIRYADMRQLDPMLILAVMRHESGFNPKARSAYGAQGLMQVVPRWHRDKLRGRSLYNPEVAIEVGTQVLSDCWTKFKGHTFRSLGCYLGGNPNKYYARIQATHVAMGRDVTESWFLAEEPIQDFPRLTMAALTMPSYPVRRELLATAPPPLFYPPPGTTQLASLNAVVPNQ